MGLFEGMVDVKERMTRLERENQHLKKSLEQCESNAWEGFGSTCCLTS